ncbi:MAG: hypothetical protein RIR62_2129 [Pseudomonadota bacterium]|jgi:hypothetical protein
MPSAAPAAKRRAGGLSAPTEGWPFSQTPSPKPCVKPDEGEGLHAAAHRGCTCATGSPPLRPRRPDAGSCVIWQVTSGGDFFAAS